MLLNDPSIYPKLRLKLEASAQSHLLDHWSELSEQEQQHFADELNVIDFHNLHKSFELTMAAEASGHGGQCLPAEGVFSLSDRATPAGAAAASRWRTLGLEAVRAGHVAALLLAGGQGTRLGSSAPKGCYDIGLPSGKSLFQLQAERILALQRQAASLPGPSPPRPLRWYIMTSLATHNDTAAYFEKMNYFGLSKDQVFFFQQGMLPSVRPDGRAILAAPGAVSLAPDGNGGLYRAALERGALSDMEAHGVQYVDCLSVDNALARPCDPTFVGCVLEARSEVGVRTCRRAGPEEKVGVFVRSSGPPHSIQIREYTELPPGSAAETDPKTGELVFPWANLCMQLISVGFMRRTAEGSQREGAAYHVARKEIATVGGAKVQGIKLEQFIFDQFTSAAGLTMFEVERYAHFGPVKNAPGGPDSPDTARALLMRLHTRWVKEAGGIPLGEVEVSPLVSLEGEGLEAVVGGKEVQGGTVVS